MTEQQQLLLLLQLPKILPSGTKTSIFRSSRVQRLCPVNRSRNRSSYMLLSLVPAAKEPEEYKQDNRSESEWATAQWFPPRPSPFISVDMVRLQEWSCRWRAGKTHHRHEWAHFWFFVIINLPWVIHSCTIDSSSPSTPSPIVFPEKNTGLRPLMNWVCTKAENSGPQFTDPSVCAALGS